MMITLVLSSNMKRMMKDNVLVRKLVGIETSGSINILFTDKTGTITKGKLEVKSIISGDFKEYKNGDVIAFSLNVPKRYDYNKLIVMVNGKKLDKNNELLYTYTVLPTDKDLVF